MRYSKIIALILSMLILVTVFVSCGNTDDVTDTTEETTNATTDVVSYTVEFVSTLQIRTETVKAGEKVESFIPTRDYHVFDGWYLDNVLFDFNTPITKDIVLIAKFSVDPEVACRQGFLNLVEQREPATVSSITVQGGYSQVNGVRIGENNEDTAVKYENNCFVSEDESIKVPVVLTKELAEGLYAEVEEVIKEKYTIDDDGTFTVLIEYKTATGEHYKLQFSAKSNNTLGGIMKSVIDENGSSSYVYRLSNISYS